MYGQSHRHRISYVLRVLYIQYSDDYGYWELANTFENLIVQYILRIRIKLYIENLSIYAVFIYTFIANDDDVFSCLFFIYFSVFMLQLHMLVEAMDDWCRQKMYTHTQNQRCKMLNCACKI